MLFNFEADHSHIEDKLRDGIEHKYLREFYLRFNSRGIYSHLIPTTTYYQSIQDQLNSTASLKTLACNSILNTANQDYIQYVINTVPAYLYHTLLKSSIYTMNDFAVKMIIENWPYESLVLEEFLHEAYSSLLLYYKTDINSFIGKIAPEILKWFLIGAKYTKLIASHSINNHNSSLRRLRLLDISGFPLSDQLVKCLLKKYSNSLCPYYSDDSSETENECSKSSDSETFIVSYSNEDSDSNSQSEEMSASDVSSEPDFDLKGHMHSIGKNKIICEGESCENLVIKFDLILDSFSLLEQYLRLLEIKQESKVTKSCGFELVINKLDLTIHDQKYCIQSSCLDLEALKINGLGIFFNASSNEAMYTFNLVNKFRNIYELNLSAFGQESYLSCLLDNTSALDALSDCFAQLKQLKRLRLNIPGCKHRLGFILRNLTNPLEYLNLTSCGLVEQDLDFLASSIHTSTINNLVLSNNDLSIQCNSLIRLLKKMKSNIQVLDLGCNSFQFDVYFKIVNEVIVKMDNLRMLVTLDVFKFDNYFKLAEKLSQLGNFVSWRINYSSDYYEKSAKIKNRNKFKKFKQDYIEALERKFTTNNGSRLVKITINDPDLNFILNGISHN